MSMNMYDWICMMSKGVITLDEFKRIMQNPDRTEEEVLNALDRMKEAGGYECLV